MPPNWAGNWRGAALLHHHIPALDGVRGLAVSLVVLQHSGLAVGGRIGVDLFFVLSGFLITGILLREQDETGRIGLRNFYARRVLRLFPALFLMVVVVTAFVAIVHPTQLWMTVQNAGSILLYFFNWVLVWQMPDATLHQSMFSHVWSLSVEEQFYLLWPLVLIIAARFRAPHTVLATIIAAGILYPAIGRAAIADSAPELQIYFRSDMRFDGLMFGAAVALLTQTCHSRPRFSTLLAILGWAALAIILVMARTELLETGALYQWGFTLVNFCGAALIASLVWCPAQQLQKLMSLAWLRWLGVISYGIYLWHWPVFRALRPLEGGWTRKVTEIALSILIAALSYYLMERRFLRLKHLFPATGGSGAAQRGAPLAHDLLKSP